LLAGELFYLKPGDFWYRNVEFGRPLTDGSKGKRGGHAIEPNYETSYKNPYHYHGYYLDGDIASV
jgi:hypothetical protein